jgi:DNA polymerase-3 subunit gamma/tau
VSQSLYRKYRSRGFDEIVGQSHVTDLLKHAVEKGSFVHAYLFTGPRGTGKTSVARILAHAINNLPYSDDSTHLDIIEIDAASNRRIDDIRDLREKVHIAPSSAPYKVYIIDEVHMLTGESFNALLKTLEEPPEHAVFILATTELHKVPATIVSRTQRFHFRPGSAKAISDHLAGIAGKEHINIEPAALELIAEHSDGGFRDSVSLLDQVSSLSSETITRDDVESLLGLAPATQINDIIDAVMHARNTEALTHIRTLHDEGISAVSMTEQLLRAAKQRAIDEPALYGLIEQLLDVPKSHAPFMKLLSVIALYGAGPAVAPVQTAAPQASTASTPHASTVPEPDVKPESKPKKSAAAPVAVTTKSVQATAITGAIEGFEWNKVTQQLKQEAPALYSVAVASSAHMDDDQLILENAFALHRTKLSSEKYQKQLVSCITALYGICPEIIVKAPAKKELDNLSAGVAALMGGGEAV